MRVVGSCDFSKKLSEELGAGFVAVDTKTFPDGENYYRINEPRKIKDEKVILVVRGKTPGLDQDKMVTESILILDKLRDLGAKKLCLFMPYMPYARQDKEFREGEIISVKSLRRTLGKKCDLMVNVTSHDFRKEGWIDKKTYNLDGAKPLRDFLKEREFPSPVVAAPDMTSKGNVEKIAKHIGGETLALRKKRDRETGEINTSGDVPDLKGKELIIFDDVASSGNTLIKAIEKGKKAGATEVICVVVHVLSIFKKQTGESSIKMVADACDEYYASDTIQNPIEGFSVIESSAEFLRKNF